MVVALSLIILACAVLLMLAFVTGRVSAVTRRTYLPPQPSRPAGDEPSSPDRREPSPELSGPDTADPASKSPADDGPEARE